MSLETIVRDRVSRALVYLYKRLGKTVSFTNRDDAPVTLYADYKPESTSLHETLKMNAEETERTFYIPRQTGFPPTDGINIGGVIAIGTKEYEIDKIDAAGDESPQFELTCTRKRAVDVGAL